MTIEVKKELPSRITMSFQVDYSVELEEGVRAVANYCFYDFPEVKVKRITMDGIYRSMQEVSKTATIIAMAGIAKSAVLSNNPSNLIEKWLHEDYLILSKKNINALKLATELKVANLLKCQLVDNDIYDIATGARYLKNERLSEKICNGFYGASDDIVNAYFEEWRLNKVAFSVKIPKSITSGAMRVKLVTY